MTKGIRYSSLELQSELDGETSDYHDENGHSSCALRSRRRSAGRKNHSNADVMQKIACLFATLLIALLINKFSSGDDTKEVLPAASSGNLSSILEETVVDEENDGM